MTLKLRNIGPKSAAWLRQVGIRTPEDLTALGAVGAFMKVRRAGFEPSLNLLYSLEGALLDCHWQELPEARRQQLVADYEAVAAELNPLRAHQQAGPVFESQYETAAHGEHDSDDTAEIRFDD